MLVKYRYNLEEKSSNFSSKIGLILAKNMADLPQDISTNVLQHYVKKHTGKMFVPSQVKKVLKDNDLQDVLKGGQVKRKDALKTIDALQKAGIVNKRKTPSEVLKKAIKKYEGHAGMITGNRARFEKRKKLRQEKTSARMNPNKGDKSFEEMMEKKQEMEMLFKRKQARKQGTMKEFLKEQMEFERKKKARREKEKVGKGKQLKSEKGKEGDGKKKQDEASMRIDF